MANYPSTLPSLTNPSSTDFMNVVLHASQHSNANDEIEAIAAELGTLAKGAYPTVRDRFNAIEASLSTKVGTLAGAALEFARYNVLSNGIEASGFTQASFATAAHTSSSDHDSRYYTEAESDALLLLKQAKVPTAANGNFASWTSGSTVDSGFSNTSFDAAGTAAAAIVAHLATHTLSVEHNPFRVGTKNVDETDISDGKVLYFNFEDNTIQYGDVIDVSQEEIEDYVSAMFITGTGPTVWTYTDNGSSPGTLRVDLPQSVALASTPTFANLILTSSTDGGVVVGNGAGALVFTAVGTAGHVLTSNGPGTDPTFQAVGGSGGTELFHHTIALMGG